MKLFKVVLFCACFLGLTHSVRAQAASTRPNGAPPGVIGYVDPLSGNFKPLFQSPTVSPDALEAITPLTGKLVFMFTITIVSTIPTTNAIICTGDADVFDTSGISIIESASVAASRTGTTATCTVTIPYSWPLTTPSSDKVILNISVSTGSSTGLLSRIHSRGLGQIGVPAMGATTNEPVKVTI